MKKSLNIVILSAFAFGLTGCIAAGPTAPPPRPPTPPTPQALSDAPVTRKEFNALKADVARLKAWQLSTRRGTNFVAKPAPPKPAVSPK